MKHPIDISIVFFIDLVEESDIILPIKDRFIIVILATVLMNFKRYRMEDYDKIMYTLTDTG